VKKIALFVSCLLLGGCLGMPESIQPVQGFDLKRYMGKWYEIARLDHPFERGLDQVTAQYKLLSDGTVSVANRGYSSRDNEWQEATGKAKFVDSENEGYLQVSFFGPFYGSYVIFELDQTDYQYAFISGPDTDYLWLLSRTPEISEDIINKFVTVAEAKGFDTSELIFVKH